MARLPFASKDGLLQELAEIAADRDRLDTATIVCPARADERRECLDRWEHDLREQLAELEEVAR